MKLLKTALVTHTPSPSTPPPPRGDAPSPSAGERGRLAAGPLIGAPLSPPPPRLPRLPPPRLPACPPARLPASLPPRHPARRGRTAMRLREEGGGLGRAEGSGKPQGGAGSCRCDAETVGGGGALPVRRAPPKGAVDARPPAPAPPTPRQRAPARCPGRAVRGPRLAGPDPSRVGAGDLDGRGARAARAPNEPEGPRTAPRAAEIEGRVTDHVTDLVAGSWSASRRPWRRTRRSSPAAAAAAGACSSYRCRARAQAGTEAGRQPSRTRARTWACFSYKYLHACPPACLSSSFSPFRVSHPPPRCGGTREATPPPAAAWPVTRAVRVPALSGAGGCLRAASAPPPRRPRRSAAASPRRRKRPPRVT